MISDNDAVYVWKDIRDLTDESLEGQLADEEVGQFLITANFPKCHRTWYLALTAVCSILWMVLPGLYRCGFLTPPVEGGRRGFLTPKVLPDRRLIQGALPPTVFLAVCLILKGDTKRLLQRSCKSSIPCHVLNIWTEFEYVMIRNTRKVGEGDFEYATMRKTSKRSRREIHID
jgi:hypothetical protein